MLSSSQNIDPNFHQTFMLTEHFKLQFRGEFYNILNHHNLYVSTENIDVSSLTTRFIQTEKGGIYGVPGQPNDERRNLQFGLKLMFPAHKNKLNYGELPWQFASLFEMKVLN